MPIMVDSIATIRYIHHGLDIAHNAQNTAANNAILVGMKMKKLLYHPALL